MGSIFSKEEEILRIYLEKLGDLETQKDKAIYEELLDEYRALLDMVKRVVKMADRIEARLNNIRCSLDEASKIDFLTNLYNRRFFYELLTKEWKTAKENNTDISILMLDIDKFKNYNDTYGHLEGDNCLQKISKSLKNAINRRRDIVARYGGEEFVILLPETNLKEAIDIAQKVRVAIEDLQIPHAGLDNYKIVTISVGVATMIPDTNTLPETLMNKADEALYRAKEQGRNRVNS